MLSAEELKELERKASQALVATGAFIMEHWLDPHNISYKNERDSATEIDVQAEEMLRKAAAMGVAKINIDTDLRLAMTATIREIFVTKPEEFDPRKYLGPARDAIKEVVKHKIKDVLGCSGKV